MIFLHELVLKGSSSHHRRRRAAVCAFAGGLLVSGRNNPAKRGEALTTQTMKLSAILLLPGAASFAPPPAAGRGPGRSTTVELSQQPAKLTESDLMNKSRVSSLSPNDEDDEPRLFQRKIYDDFQSALLTLEKRLADGAITLEEYGRFDAETGRIVREMNEFLADPEGCRERIEKEYEAEGGVSVPEAKSPGVLDAGSAAAVAASKVAQGEGKVNVIRVHSAWEHWLQWDSKDEIQKEAHNQFTLFAFEIRGGEIHHLNSWKPTSHRHRRRR